MLETAKLGPGLCRLIDAHTAVIRSGRTISFDDWLAEQLTQPAAISARLRSQVARR
jgi:hypothetical protein